MEEILRDLKKLTLEKGPQNKQFYTNLCVTKSLHDHAEIQQKLNLSVTYLKSRFESGTCFQSKFYTNRNCAIDYTSVSGNSLFNFSQANISEVLTSVFALDLLFNSIDNESYVDPQFQQIICNFSNDVVDQLHDFIVPSYGISTFNLFKRNDDQGSSPVLSSPSPHRHLSLENGDTDSGNDSPISMHGLLSSPTGELQNRDIIHLFPDDIFTSMITLYALLHQGILQVKPVESVLSWVASNVFKFESANEEVVQQSSTLTSVFFPTFVNQQGSNDPVGVANTLKLLYLLDINHESLVNAAEGFLLMALKDAINSASSPSAVNLLGNTQAISSHSLSKPPSENEDVSKVQESTEASFMLHHNSPDSLLYFLSRTLATSYNDGMTSSTCRRPNVTEMKRLLLELLDIRLGTSKNCCDLAMRILSGVYLGVVTTSKHDTGYFGTYTSAKQGQVDQKICSSGNFEVAKVLRVNSLLQKEFELLMSLHNESDGSWQADSIVSVGFVDSVTDNDDEFGNIMNIGYLGGKEISTLFAIKAISVYLTAKKTTLTESSAELSEWPSGESDIGGNFDVHKMY